MNKYNDDNSALIFFSTIVIGVILYNLYMSLSLPASILLVLFVSGISSLGLVYLWENHSKPGREKKKKREKLKHIPDSIRIPSNDCVLMGEDKDLKASIITFVDSKTKLQEYSLKKFKKLPIYKIISNTGPRHKPLFKVGVKLLDTKLYISEGKSKKDAEQNAAILCLQNIK